MTTQRGLVRASGPALFRGRTPGIQGPTARTRLHTPMETRTLRRDEKTGKRRTRTPRGHDYFLLAARHNKRSYRPPAPRPTDRPRHVSAPSNPLGARRVRPRRRGPARALTGYTSRCSAALVKPRSLEAEKRGGETNALTVV